MSGMIRTSRLAWALTLAGAVGLGGCASSKPFGFGQRESGGNDPQGAASNIADARQADVPPAMQASPPEALANVSSESSWTKKMFDKVSDTLTIESRVIPANDAIRLSSDPGPINPDVYVKAARLYECREDMGGAVVQYRRALEIEENNLAALIGLARLHDRQGEFQAAKNYYRQAIAAHPESAVAQNDYGLCCARQGELDEALAALGQAVQLEPERVLYRNNIAKVLVRSGQLQEAADHLAAVHREAIAHYNMAHLLQNSGDLPAARRYVAQATLADPDFRAAAHLRSQLEGNPALASQTTAAQPTAAPARGGLRVAGRPVPLPSVAASGQAGPDQPLPRLLPPVLNPNR